MLRINVEDEEGRLRYDECDAGIQFYTPRETTSPWAAITAHPVPMARPSATACAEFLKPIIEQCYDSHTECQAKFKDQLQTEYVPTRLLYIGSRVPHDSPLLYEPARDAAQPYGSGTPYIALSHCWGNTRILTTKTANRDNHSRSIKWSSLTKTFRDAIDVSRALGIDYIWIDSLCIVQDSASDWAHESAQMAEIYINACLTIGASAAKDGNDGLFFERPEPQIITTTHQGAETSIHVRHFPYHELEDYVGVNTLALRTRSWTLQEELLSTRFVHFTREEVIWSCFSGTTCECRHDLRRTFYMSATIYEPSGIGWAELIENFTSREITYFYDRLPALSGISKALGYKGKYLAGLWSEHLPANLLWRVDGYTDDRYNAIRLGSDPPSWSWASIDFCTINSWIYQFNSDSNNKYWDYQFADHRRGGHRPEAEVLEAITWPGTEDPNGRCKGGRLVLKAELFPLESAWTRDRSEFTGGPKSEADVRVAMSHQHPLHSQIPSCLVGLDYQALLPEREGAKGKFNYPVKFLLLTSTNQHVYQRNSFWGLIVRDAQDYNPERLEEILGDGERGWKRFERIGVGEMRCGFGVRPEEMDGVGEVVVLI